MLIALDYDGTYTTDPELWNSFISLCRERGHEIIIATMRYDNEEVEEVKQQLEHRVNAIICTNRQAKKDYVTKHYKRPDIWIDDTPEWLFEDALVRR